MIYFFLLLEIVIVDDQYAIKGIVISNLINILNYFLHYKLISLILENLVHQFFFTHFWLTWNYIWKYFLYYIRHLEGFLVACLYWLVDLLWLSLKKKGMVIDPYKDRTKLFGYNKLFLIVNEFFLNESKHSWIIARIRL